MRASNMLIPTLCWTLGSSCLPILLLQQGLLQSKFKANPILFALHLHLEIPPTSQVHGEMLQLDQTRSVTMILKGKDMEWWIDTTASTAWRQQIPSLQGFELIVMGTSQRFHYYKSDVERICCWSTRGSEGHHGTMGYKAMKWTLHFRGNIGLTSSKSYDLMTFNKGARCILCFMTNVDV